MTSKSIQYQADKVKETDPRLVSGVRAAAENKPADKSPLAGKIIKEGADNQISPSVQSNPLAHTRHFLINTHNQSGKKQAEDFFS